MSFVKIPTYIFTHKVYEFPLVKLLDGIINRENPLIILNPCATVFPLEVEFWAVFI